MAEPNFTPHPDFQLVLGFLSGEETAILPITERLQCIPRILSAQNRRFGSPLDVHDLADLTQDTTVVVLRKMDRFKGLAPFEGWVYRICCFEFRNGLRRKRRNYPVQSLQPDTDVVQESNMEEWADKERVLRALELVGGLEAELIAEKHFEGLTFDEIAKRREMSPNTVKTRYYRGMARLERVLTSLNDHDQDGEG